MFAGGIISLANDLLITDHKIPKKVVF